MTGGNQDLGDGHLADYYSDYLTEHGLRDGQPENEFESDDPTPFPKSRFPPSQINAMHANSDVDSSQQAQHHTLGPRHNQASPGDHVHNGVTSKGLGVWQNWTPTWNTVGAGTSPSLGNGVLLGRYMQIGGTLFGRLVLVAGSTTTFGSGSWTFSMPPLPMVGHISPANQYEGGVGVALASNGSSGSPLQPSSSYRGIVSADMWTNALQILSDNMLWSGTMPWTWTTVSGFNANFMYETNMVS